MDNTELFTRKSEDYALFRPSYPREAADFLRQRCGTDAHVADIGAGTGIFTRALLPCFHKVTAVEPNADMRKRFAELLPGILCTAGTAEATLLPESSVDLITAAQAFHWFDEEKFKSEAKRILRPNGKVAIIWNTSLKNAFTIARDEICKKYCPRFRSGHAGKRTPAEGDNFLRHIYFQKVEFVSFANHFEMTPDIFEGNMRSRSYMPVPGDDTFEACMEELRSVFDRFATCGKVTEEVETQIFLGEFTP